VVSRKPRLRKAKVGATAPAVGVSEVLSSPIPSGAGPMVRVKSAKFDPPAAKTTVWSPSDKDTGWLQLPDASATAVAADPSMVAVTVSPAGAIPEKVRVPLVYQRWRKVAPVVLRLPTAVSW